MIGIASSGSSQTKASGIFLLTPSGNVMAIRPTMAATIMTVAVQPYQYMAGPSPLRAASQPQAMRFVAGWKVKSGRFQSTQIAYITGAVMPKATTKVLNLAEAANDDVDGVVRLVVAVVVIMSRTPARC